MIFFVFVFRCMFLESSKYMHNVLARAKESRVRSELGATFLYPIHDHLHDK